MAEHQLNRAALTAAGPSFCDRGPKQLWDLGERVGW